MKRNFVLTDKVKDLNGTDYATGYVVNSSSIDEGNEVDEAMMENFLNNHEDDGLILFADYGI